MINKNALWIKKLARLSPVERELILIPVQEGKYKRIKGASINAAADKLLKKKRKKIA